MKRPAFLLLLVLLAACERSATATAPAQSASPSATTPSASASPARAAALEDSLPALVGDAGGTVGVAAVHVPTGQKASLRGGERFPMASVYKLPIAIAFLRRVDAGEASLDESLSYGASDLRPGLADSPINARLKALTAQATARELVLAMMVESDNTASDLILRRAGGPEAVMATLRQKGIEGVDVSRPEGRLALDWWGVASPPPEAEWTLARFGRLRAQVKAADRRAAAERFAADPRDTATPDGMAALLVRLQKGELLSAASTRFLLEAMARATTGPGRLKGLLPAGTAVAHKTGTGGDTAGVNCCTNDVGLITLPGGGQVAVAVFVKSSTKPLEARERAMARVAKAAYDHWTAGTAGTPR